jgi:hypothetical protein
LPTRVPVGCPGDTPSGLKLPLLSCWGLLLAVSAAVVAALVVDAVWVDVLGLGDPCALVEAVWPVLVHADRTKRQPAMAARIGFMLMRWLDPAIMVGNRRPAAASPHAQVASPRSPILA